MKQQPVFPRSGAAWAGLALVAALLTPGAGAKAAPFCLQNEGLPPQCIYQDPNSCARDARQQGGTSTCSVNPREVRNIQGMGAFCVVVAGVSPSCVYVDRASCDRAAGQLNGVCAHGIARARTAPGVGAPDPFAVAPGALPPGRRDPYGPFTGGQ